MSTNVPQAQTSLTTNMAAPPISNFQGVPPAVKGSTARKHKASTQHSLPQHQAGRSQLNPFNFVSTKEINICLVFFPHVVCKFIFWFVKYTYSLNQPTGVVLKWTGNYVTIAYLYVLNRPVS
jgi:hypothetical protein